MPAERPPSVRRRSHGNPAAQASDRYKVRAFARHGSLAASSMWVGLFGCDLNETVERGLELRVIRFANEIRLDRR